MNIIGTLLVLLIALTITAKAHGADLVGKGMDDWSAYISETIKAGLAYGWFLVLAIWGGTASYISRMRQKSLPFSLAELLGEWLISGFSGIMTALICTSYGLDPLLIAALCGITGHLGGRGVYMLEQWATAKLKGFAGK